MRRVRNIHHRWIAVFAAFSITAGTFYFLLLHRNQIDPAIPPTHPPFNSTKTILLYTPYFKSRDWELGELGTAPFSECPVRDCHVTDDPAELPSVAEFDAVLFHLKV